MHTLLYLLWTQCQCCLCDTHPTKKKFNDRKLILRDEILLRRIEFWRWFLLNHPGTDLHSLLKMHGLGRDYLDPIKHWDDLRLIFNLCKSLSLGRFALLPRLYISRLPSRKPGVFTTNPSLAGSELWFLSSIILRELEALLSFVAFSCIQFFLSFFFCFCTSISYYVLCIFKCLKGRCGI